jgi:hypothetical protein
MQVWVADMRRSRQAVGVPFALLHAASKASQLVKQTPKAVLPIAVAGTDPASMSSNNAKSSLVVDLLMSMIFILSNTRLAQLVHCLVHVFGTCV